jgi:hypothetical protein
MNAAKTAATPEKRAYWNARLNKQLGLTGEPAPKEKPLPGSAGKHWVQRGDDVLYKGVSRHMRHKISHDIRKGTKLGFGGKAYPLDDMDIVARYGRLAVVELERTRYNAAITDLNAVGMRKDLKKASVIDQAVEGAKAAFDTIFDLSKFVFRRKEVVAP